MVELTKNTSLTQNNQEKKQERSQNKQYEE